MALVVSGKRVFKFEVDKKVKDLEDPNSDMTAQEVMDFYSNHYPELVNGAVKGPDLGEDDTIIYHFSFTPKTKG